MKKLITTFLFIPFLDNSAQNFNTAKTKLVWLYKFNPEQTTFYCGCEFSWTGKKGIVDFSKCGYEPRKNQTRAERIEWEHVMPAENFGRHLQCWRDGGRKECKKDTKFNEMEGDLHNLQPSIVKLTATVLIIVILSLQKSSHNTDNAKAQLILKIENFSLATESGAL